jgi:hypothetical protein
MVEEMNCGCNASTGTMNTIVTNAVTDIMKPEIAYERIAL